MMRIESCPNNLSYSLRRYFVDVFFCREVAQLPPSCLILDVGGVKIRKRGQFDIEDYDQRVFYVNLSPAKEPHVLGDAIALPFMAQTFDIVVCSELIEHVYHPALLLEESRRVLRPGGRLLLTVPFLFPYHADPEDYWRFSEASLRRMLGEAGFCVIGCERQGGYWCVLADMLRGLANECQGQSRWARFLLLSGGAMLVRSFRRLALRLDRRRGTRNTSYLQGFTTGFGVIAETPAVSAEGRSVP